MSDQPSCAVCASLSGPERREPIYEDELWQIPPADPTEVRRVCDSLLRRLAGDRSR